MPPHIATCSGPARAAERALPCSHRVRNCARNAAWLKFLVCCGVGVSTPAPWRELSLVRNEAFRLSLFCLSTGMHSHASDLYVSSSTRVWTGRGEGVTAAGLGTSQAVDCDRAESSMPWYFDECSRRCGCERSIPCALWTTSVTPVSSGRVRLRSVPSSGRWIVTERQGCRGFVDSLDPAAVFQSPLKPGVFLPVVFCFCLAVLVQLEPRLRNSWRRLLH